MTPMNKTFQTLIASLLLTPFAAFADTTYSVPKDAPALSIAFPADWEVNTDEDGLVATSKDEDIELDLWALKGHSDPKKMLEEIENSAKEIASDIDEYVTDFKVEESKKGELNGIQAATFGGTGKSKEDDSEVNVEVTYLSPDGKNLYALMYWGSEEAEKANQAALQSISKSLKKH
jgi:hypothetical protein